MRMTDLTTRRRGPRGKKRAWSRVLDSGPTIGIPRESASGSLLGWPVLLAIPLAAFTVVFLWGGPPQAQSFPTETTPAAIPAASADSISAAFQPCEGPVRFTCVVDGDTIWYRGEKIRIADINAPEISSLHCAEEKALGAEATERLTDLLNEGPFSFGPNPDGRSRDQYGRSLRIITRDGRSLGADLVDEGLAEEWQGFRGGWC